MFWHKKNGKCAGEATIIKNCCDANDANEIFVFWEFEYSHWLCFNVFVYPKENVSTAACGFGLGDIFWKWQPLLARAFVALRLTGGIYIFTCWLRVFEKWPNFLVQMFDPRIGKTTFLKSLCPGKNRKTKARRIFSISTQFDHGTPCWVLSFWAHPRHFLFCGLFITAFDRTKPKKVD